MHVHWGCYCIISILIKMIPSCWIFSRKCKGFPVGFCGKRNRNLNFYKGAMLTVSLEAILRLTLLCITVRKGKKDIFISLSFSLSLTYISSSLSVWSSILNSLPFLLDRSFHNSGFDCSLTFCQSLKTINFL